MYLDRPWEWQEVEAARFQDIWHIDMARVSALCTSYLYSQEIFLVHISVRGWVDPRAIMQLEGLCQGKIPMIPLGIEAMTFWLVAQCFGRGSCENLWEKVKWVLFPEPDWTQFLKLILLINSPLTMLTHLCSSCHDSLVDLQHTSNVTAVYNSY